MKSVLLWTAAILGTIALFAVLWPREAITPEERKALAEGRTIIIYWDRHTGHEHDARRTLIDEFNRTQDKIYIRALPVGAVTIMEKLLTSVAGHCPPDLCSVEGGMMTQLVAEGCFTPLDDYVKREPYVTTDKYLPHVRKAIEFEGHRWAMPTGTDSFALLWNKNAFRKAGLDPERPPQTFAELEAYAARLTIHADHGIEQIGFLPWQPWDQTEMWGGLFGGKWYDSDQDRVICGNDPGIIRMFEWQKTFAIAPGDKTQPRAYATEVQKVLSFQQGFGAYASANNPFYSGKVAMQADGEWQVKFISKYAPDLDWGVAPLPTPDGQIPRTFSPTVVADCIPKGCPHPEEAWAFLDWFYSPRPGGGTSPVSDYDAEINNIPPRADEAQDKRFISDPRFRVFVEGLLNREVISSPVFPVYQYFYDETGRQREKMSFGQVSPREAAQVIEDNSNAELSRVRKALGKARK